MRKLLLSGAATFFCAGALLAQTLGGGTLSGNFQIDAQTGKTDHDINATKPDETILSNSYLNLNYNNGPISLGARYEAYQDPLLGFDSRYKGTGIPYRYLTYKADNFEATVGNFYEQFGSGLILRSYEDKYLGIDNSFEGVRFKAQPTQGVNFTGLVGKQRSFWSYSDGLTRGGDLSVSVGDVIPEFLPDGYTCNLGVSAVSRYQADKNPNYVMPKNVFAYSTRLNLTMNDFTIEGEYGRKSQDPSAQNKYIYKYGEGAFLTLGYAIKGFSASISGHRLDNMDFRGDRDASGQVAMLNYFPAMTRQQVYRLATIYPFSTQLMGEAGIQADVNYTCAAGSALGGEYGTTFSANYSRVNGIRKHYIKDAYDSTKSFTYSSPFFETSNQKYFEEYNLDMQKLWSEKFKSTFSLIYQVTNRDVMEAQGAGEYGQVKSFILVADMLYKITHTQAIKLELQHMWSKQDSSIKTPDNENGAWATALAEYTIAPKWFLSAWDEYNYGNHDSDKKLHYLNCAATLVLDNLRASVGYGRKRGGLLCVGGVCRNVPASNGFSFTLSQSF